MWNNGEVVYLRNLENVLVDLETNDESKITPHLVSGRELKVGMIVRSYDNVHLRPKCGDGEIRCADCDPSGTSNGSKVVIGPSCGERLVFQSGSEWWIPSTGAWIEGRVEKIGEVDACRCNGNHIQIHADKASHPQGPALAGDRLFTGSVETKKMYYPHEGHFFVIVEVSE